jgi:ABC-type sugar transport system substrate-binding protein
MGGDGWKFRAGARTALVMAALGVAGAAAGCGSSADDGGGATTSASAGGGGSLEGRTVQFLSCVDTNTFCGTTNRYVSERLGARGVRVTVQQANFDPVQQALQFDQAIAAKPDLIMIQVADPNAIVPSLRKARQAGIPVVNTIGRLGEDSYEMLAASVECDCDALGRQAAQNVVRGMRELGLDSGNVVAITGSRAQNISADRIRAFEDELAETPEYRLVAVEDGTGPTARAPTSTASCRPSSRRRAGSRPSGAWPTTRPTRSSRPPSRWASPSA